MEKTLHLLITYTMLVLFLFLFHKGRKHPRSLLLAFYALIEVLTNGIISLNYYIGISIFEHYPFTHFIYKPLYCLWAPFFYLYFRYCYSLKFQFKTRHLWHFLPFAIAMIAFLWVWIFKGNNYILENLYGKHSNISKMSKAIDILVKIQYIYYNTLMIIKQLQLNTTENKNSGKINDIAVPVRWLNFIVVGYASASTISIFSLYFYMIQHPNRSLFTSISLLYFLVFFFIIFYNTITHKPYELDANIKISLEPNDEMKVIMHKVEQMVYRNEKYLDPELSLLQIATEIGEKERNISQAINTIEHRNVKDYINFYRIEYSCKLLKSEINKPVFEVMYESGFNTKGAFNLAFKKQVGMTPTEFREMKLG